MIDKIGKGSKSGGGTPTGTILAYASNGALPDGYLSCDGSAVSRTTYADLFDVIGTTWGSGNGSSTFNLPSLNDGWLKGDSTAGIDISAGLPDIKGSITKGFTRRTWGVTATTGAFGATTVEQKPLTSGDDTKSTDLASITFSASKSNSIYGASTTVQPTSKTVRYIIKY
jgi:microcystin-dependent protein